MPSLSTVPLPLPAPAARSIYPGLTDCQICILESLTISGPADEYSILCRVNRELAESGFHYHLLFTLKEVSHAVDGLQARHMIQLVGGLLRPI